MRNETVDPRPPIVESLDINGVEPHQLTRFRVVMTENATGNESLVPVIVVRAADPHPVVGLTAAIHGNELNGIRVIHQLMRNLGKVELLRGTIVAVPIVNIPGYLRQQREFEDGVDLNRIMPGKPDGTESELYARRFVDRVLSQFEYLIDLHTASEGRVNTLYVRADMKDKATAKMARLLAPQIIVHSEGHDGTLRGAAEDRGIPSVTVEVGDPQRFQQGMVREARLGLQEVLEYLKMLPDISDPVDREVIECNRSYWMYTDRGGMLSVKVGLGDEVEKGQILAELHNVWGDLVRKYMAPEDGVIVGKSTNPAARAGSRIVHLGVVGR